MFSRRGDRRTRARRGGAAAATLLAAATAVACSAGDGTDAGGGLGDTLDGDQVSGVAGDAITLGAITVQSGPMGEAGRSLTAGNRAYFAALDEEGGVAGEYRVEIEVLDGADDPATLAAAYQRSRGDVALYVQVTGFRAATVALEPLAADDALAGAAALDFPWSRHQNLLALGTPFTVGVHNALDWYVHEPGARSSVCALADRGDYGAAIAEATEASASVLYLDAGPVVDLGAGSGRDGATTAVAAAVDDLAGEGCDVVVAGTLPAATTAAVARAAATGFAPVWFVPVPGGPALDDPAVAAYAADHVWLVGDDTWSGPGPEPSVGRDELEAARRAHAPGIAEDDPWFLLGWLQARAAHQVLERAVELGDLTPAGILSAANYSERLDFAGLTADYPFGGPEFREPPRTTVLMRPGGDEVVTVGDDLPRTGSTPFEQEMIELRTP
ncbi:MAG TPA: ABC transporter substrate-binding protein [Acidimicrobiales bacterium]|nr:ABC transporter substrate-binding protein [Acidimicrobiales bacterium]